MATATLTTRLDDPDDFYPERDGKPMAETTVHQEAMIELILGLRDRFAADPSVWVAGNLFLYFVEGDPTRVVSPDVMVVRGVEHNGHRRTFKTWEERGRTPDLVVEVSSKSTRREDFRQKFLLYRDELRVREYVVFDPLGEYLRPRLQGFRLEGDDYFAIDPVAGRLRSDVLGLDLGVVGETLRLFDSATGELIPNRLEALAAARHAGDRQATVLADRDLTIREQRMTIRERDMTIREHEMAISERDMTIRERDMTIAERDLEIGQKDLAIGRLELERDRLRDEIARLRGRDPSA